MTKFTKERLEEIAELARKATYKPCAMHMTNLLAVCDSEVIEEMARQLLASMEQEPVAYMHHSGQVVTREECCDDEIFAICCKVETPLYAAPQLPQPAVPDMAAVGEMPFLGTQEKAFVSGWNACRAAMLQGAEPVSQPYTLPDGYCIMPMKLTAENGAKCALAGEFSETKFISCPECFGDDECETCDGTGRIEISVPVSWTTIKDIWAKGVEHFAEAAPQQEVK